jgi:hypothetical protein
MTPSGMLAHVYLNEILVKFKGDRFKDVHMAYQQT